MLSNIQKNIIVKAVKIRVRNGEEIDVVLMSYAKLTGEERKIIKEACVKDV